MLIRCCPSPAISSTIYAPQVLPKPLADWNWQSSEQSLLGSAGTVTPVNSPFLGFFFAPCR